MGSYFGAGTSIACRVDAPKSKIPGVKEMTEVIIGSITDKKYISALEKIKVELEDNKQEFYIEYILSSIIQKLKVIGEDKLCDLVKKDFEALTKIIEAKIIEIVSVHKNLSEFRE